MKFKDLNEDQQKTFSQAFTEEMTSMLDKYDIEFDESESPCPWACPWDYQPEHEIVGTIEEQAKTWAHKHFDVIKRLSQEEKESNEDY